MIHKTKNKKELYENDLANNVGTIVNEYENDRERFWASKGPDYKIEYDKAERFAQFVLKGTENLANTQKIEEDMASFQYEATKENVAEKEFNGKSRSIMKPGKTPSKEEIEKIKNLALKFIEELPEEPRNENSPLRLVWERFCIDLGYEAEKKIDEGADRIFKLYRLMLSSPPSRPTIGYLLRLSRCYIWGFDLECIILCRSVLDTAFRDKISDDICEKHCREKQLDLDFTLSNRHTCCC